jgi:hypothetical protein
LGSYKFLAYLECIQSYAWSKGHSDPDPSSVIYYISNKKKTNKRIHNHLWTGVEIPTEVILF